MRSRCPPPGAWCSPRSNSARPASGQTGHPCRSYQASTSRGCDRICNRERRRRWSVEEKLRIVAETHEPGGQRAGGCGTARRVSEPAAHLAALGWPGSSRCGTACVFRAVRVLESAPAPAAVSPVVAERAAADTIEISLPDGSRVRVGSDVDLTALRPVMTVLHG
jgi:transposase